MSSDRHISEHGLELIKALEGSRAKAYRDSGGAWTIGVGHLIRPDEQELLTATLSEQEINDLLRADLAHAEAAVNQGLLVAITQNQFDALVSFAFNVGTTAFGDSTLLERVNHHDEPQAITAEFMRWTKDNGRTVPGLQQRRKREASYYWQHLSTLAVVLFIGAAILLLSASVILYA